MILFQDDDTVVIERDFEKFVMNNRASTLTPYCLGDWHIANARVIRPENQRFTSAEVEKWSVATEIYPKDFYPPYCSGTCYSISSSYATVISKTASVTDPQRFHHDDVLFTGILRVKTGIDIPTRVEGICKHYNQITKIQDIKNVVLEYCLQNNILKSLCLIK